MNLTIILSHFFAALTLWMHPVHVSVTEFNYNEKDKALQATVRLFIDDLELSIRNKRKDQMLEILEPKGGLKTDDLVKEYLLEHLRVKLDGKPQVIHYLGHEIDDVAIVCYVEIEKVRKFRAIEIFHDSITETWEDQSNLVHVTYKGPIKGMRLMQQNPSGTLVFENK